MKRLGILLIFGFFAATATSQQISGTVYLESGEQLKFKHILFCSVISKNPSFPEINPDLSTELPLDAKVSKLSDPSSPIFITGNITLISTVFKDLKEINVLDFKVDGTTLRDTKVKVILKTGQVVEPEYTEMNYLELNFGDKTDKIFFAGDNGIKIRKIVFD